MELCEGLCVGLSDVFSIMWHFTLGVCEAGLRLLIDLLRVLDVCSVSLDNEVLILVVKSVILRL